MILSEQSRDVARLASAAEHKRAVVRCHRDAISRWQRDTLGTPAALGLAFGGGLVLGMTGKSETGTTVSQRAYGLASLALSASRFLPLASVAGNARTAS